MIFTCKCGNKKMVVTQTKTCTGCKDDVCFFTEAGQCDWLDKECDGKDFECPDFKTNTRERFRCDKGFATSSGCTICECSQCGKIVKRRIEAHEE